MVTAYSDTSRRLRLKENTVRKRKTPGTRTMNGLLLHDPALTFRNHVAPGRIRLCDTESEEAQ